MASPPADLDGDLAVDVLVIGAGHPGAVHRPRGGADLLGVRGLRPGHGRRRTLESDGYLSAGYDGNDVNRIQPARRAAAWWRLWAESNGVGVRAEPTWYVVAPRRAVDAAPGCGPTPRWP